MSRVNEYSKARRSLEDAIADLISKALSYDGASQGWKTRELLTSAREYGRAFNRIEIMRTRS